MADYNIRLMTEIDLENIAGIDAVCFSRKRMRSMENLKCIYHNFPDGCFVATEGDNIIGYVFSHVFGKTGFIGPLGVPEEYRGKKISQAYIKKSIEALQRHGCTAIGLETRPEWPNNIGLYYKMGFTPTFLTVTGTFSEELTYSSSNILDGANIEPDAIELFDKQFEKHNIGYSFINDINFTLKHNPDKILFYVKSKSIMGFLAFDTDIYPFVWGIIHPMNDTSIFTDLLFSLKEKIDAPDIKIRINARYTSLQDLIRNGYKVEDVSVRMMLNGHEGDFIKHNNNSLVIRSWIS